MDLRKQLATKNDCYKTNQYRSSTKGIMWHSTGANNPYLSRYVQPDDGSLGVNKNNNSWNKSGVSKCCHAFIGHLKDKKGIATYQILPWGMRGWHAGTGKNGSANASYIGFEICEDGLTDKAYAMKVYQEAVELTAYLCELYKLNPLGTDVIIDHARGHKLGIASNHGDVLHWFGKWGITLDKIRKDVKAEMTKEVAKEETGTFSDLPKSHWAYKEIENLAEKGIISGYSGIKLFKPNEPLLRQQAAKMIALSAGLVASDLIDLDKSNVYPNEYIIALERAGVVGGYSTDRGKEFRPLDNTKRSHMAKMVVLAFKLKKGSKVINFDDKTGTSDQEYIDILASHGIVDGYKEGGKTLFKPYEDVTRAQAAKIIDLAMKIK